MNDLTGILAQLRHLYHQMIDGHHVTNTSEAAKGILGPCIEYLERLQLDTPVPVPGVVMFDSEQTTALREEIFSLKKQLEASQLHSLDVTSKYADALVRKEEANNKLESLGWIKEALEVPSDEITDEELCSLDKADRAASPAPWGGEAQQPSVWITNSNGQKIADLDTWVGEGWHDLEVIVQSRNLLRKMITTIRRLWSKNG